MKGKPLVQAIVIVIAVATGLVLSQKPWRYNAAASAEADAQVKQTEEAEARVRELARQEAYAQSPAGREEQARRQGMLLPGENYVEPKKAPANPR